jgi:hypothetical protein
MGCQNHSEFKLAILWNVLGRVHATWHPTNVNQQILSDMVLYTGHSHCLKLAKRIYIKIKKDFENKFLIICELRCMMINAHVIRVTPVHNLQIEK